MNTTLRSLLIGGISSLGVAVILGPGCSSDPASGSEQTSSTSGGGATSTAGHGGATATSSSQGGGSTSSTSQGAGGGSSGIGVWSKRFGGPQNDDAAMATDTMGNALLAGGINGSDVPDGVTLGGAGQGDAFVAKFNGAGKLLWAKSFGDGDWQGANVVRADASGNVLLAGDFDGTINLGGVPLINSSVWNSTFVAKFDPAGAHL